MTSGYPHAKPCKALTTKPRHIWDDLGISTGSNRITDWLFDQLET